MNRFFGMMPSSEVKKQKRFKVGTSQLEVTIQAGENGWSILYADNSTRYDDVVDTTENNFNTALKILKSNFCNINDV